MRGQIFLEEVELIGGSGLARAANEDKGHLRQAFYPASQKLSMINPFVSKVLEEINSPFSGKILVKKDWNNLYVTTNDLTQSGGLINELWDNLFKKMRPDKNKSWLVLGLATGTVAKIISKKFAPQKIVGVEIDPEMIRIGKKFFDLNKIPNLEIINKDAEHLAFSIKHFDFVLVDMYLGDKMPNFVYSENFLQKVKRNGQVAVFNHLFFDDEKRANAEKLIKSLGKIYPKIELVRILTNVLVICS